VIVCRAEPVCGGGVTPLSSRVERIVARLVELRREIFHTDSPRFREELYEVDGALQRLLAQLPISAEVSR
jgi:hypothetical protein